MSALSSANVRVRASSPVAFPCWASAGRAADSKLKASSNVIEFPVTLQGFRVWNWGGKPESEVGRYEHVLVEIK